jgi:hypothetical protein
MKVYITKYPEITRDCHTLILELANHLKTTYDAEIIAPTEPVWEFNFVLDDFNMTVRDCEILIEQDGFYKGMTLADHCTQLSTFINNRNTKGDILLVGQLKSNNGMFWPKGKIESLNYKVFGGIYAPFYPFFNYDMVRILRPHVPKIDKFVIKGNTGPAFRTVPGILEGNQYFTGGNALPKIPYFLDLMQYKVGLSIPGAGEMCHRDIEYMAIGLPLMKFEYMTPLTPELIPNFHYISIPRIDNFPIRDERIGGQEYADAYVKRFLEVKDDQEFLDFISKNAMEYYDKYLHPNTRIPHILNLMEIK